MELDRRTFLAGAAGLSLAGSALTAGSTEAAAGQSGRRLKIAALTPVYHKYSHSQHIVDRFLEGYGWDGSHHRPEMDIVSLYVEQVGDGDLSRDRAARHPGMKIYPTIAEALTLGGEKLAVDGVLLIGEHGEYPKNEKGQTLYPRYEYFQQVVDVYRRSGRTAPLFNDKHLSWNWDWAREMYDTAREMGFGLMAGSSLPVGRRIPAVDLPWGTEIEEVVGVWNNSPDGGDIHLLEAMQCLVERRRGGESGVQSVHALRGDAFWTALRSGSWDAGGWDARLFKACLCRADVLMPAWETYNHVFPTSDELQRMAPTAYAYRFEYRDGLKATVMMLPDGVGDCTVAIRQRDGNVLSTLFHLPYFAVRNFFNPQVHHIETFFRTGKSPYPVERTLLTTGMTAAGLESAFQGHRRLETPHLAIAYEAPKASTFWSN